jgi:hypothetical protein
MLKQVLTAASLAVLLAGTATAANDHAKPSAAPKASADTVRPARTAAPADHRRDHDRGRDHRGDDRGRDHRGDRDRDRDDWRGHDGRGDHDGRRGHDRRRDNDWRRDDDWRRHGWVYHGSRNDGWRYYRGQDHRHWRYVPPPRYTFDFGYRSGYELAWRDWLAYGRHNPHWRRRAVSVGYRSGYDAGWRDAAYYYARGYRPAYWAYDPHGGWYFSFSISG